MAAEKKLFINQISAGQQVDGLFLVKEMGLAETRNGKPYLFMTLMDRSGELPGRVWENAEKLMPECESGQLVFVAGQAQAYKGVLQLKIDNLRKADEQQLDYALFLPSVSRDIDEMAAQLSALVINVQDPYCRKLLLKFFSDSDFFNEFKMAPAAKIMHHAYIGGLLEHTLSVSRLAETVAGLYPGLDRDLLLAGALLHDIGKVKEFSFNSYPFDYTDKGRLVGHLVLGAEMVQERVNSITDFPDDLSSRIQHLVLSHHGRHEFGSPTLPMMSEAFVLNFLDDLDAKLNYLGRLEERAPEDGYQWTDFQRPLDRFLFIKGRPHQENIEPGHEDEQNSPENESDNGRQQNLF